MALCSLLLKEKDMRIPLLTNSWTGHSVYSTEISNSTMTYCGYIPADQYTTDITADQEFIPGLATQLKDEEEES